MSEFSPAPPHELAAQDTEIGRWLAARAGVGQLPCRRPLPDPVRVAQLLESFRRVIYPEIWTGSAPTVDTIVEAMSGLRHELSQLVLTERLSRPDKEGPAATGPVREDELESARQFGCYVAEIIIANIPELRAALEADLQAALDGDPAARSRAEVVLCYPGFGALTAWRLANRLWRAGAILCARMLTEQAHARSGIDLHPGATIADGLFIDHGTGVVVGETAVIGRGVRLYQGVTLGARSLGRGQLSGKRHPTLEDGVVIYANATILGGDTVIGRGAVIGGNAWVTESVAPGVKLRMEQESGRGGPAG